VDVDFLCCACNSADNQAPEEQIDKLNAQVIAALDKLLGKGNWYRCEMLICFRLLAVQQNDDPTQEQIDKLHAQFTAALKKLFDDNKHILGPVWAKKQLNVI